MKHTVVIDNSQDVMDSRDIIEHYEALAEERQALLDAIAEAKTALDEAQHSP